MARILLLTNGPMGEPFLQALRKFSSMDVHMIYIPLPNGKKMIHKMRRHAQNFLLALYALINHRQYSHIVFTEQFIGFAYGNLRRWFPLDKSGPGTLVLNIVYKKRTGLLGKFYYNFFKRSVNGPVLQKCTCVSQAETSRYQELFCNNTSGKIICTPFGLKSPIESRLMRDPLVTSYIISSGTMHRDYHTLITAFGSMPDLRLKIICNPLDVTKLNVPENVEILGKVHGVEYERILNNAMAMIIPLENSDFSAGVSSLLDAMRFGIPVLITRACFCDDYGGGKYFLMFEPRSSESIKEKVEEFMAHQKHWEERAQQAKIFYEKNFTEEKYVQRICEALLNVS